MLFKLRMLSQGTDFGREAAIC